ncbi:hypothetical protein HPB47_017661, partial [Ixodes persulcatus]
MPVNRTPPRTSRPSDVLSPGRLPFAEDAGVRRSRRTRGQSPELGLLPDRPRPKKTTMANQSQAPAAPVIYMPVAPRTAAPFHGELYEEVEDWIDQYDRHTGRYDTSPEETELTSMALTVAKPSATKSAKRTTSYVFYEIMLPLFLLAGLALSAFLFVRIVENVIEARNATKETEGTPDHSLKLVPVERPSLSSGVTTEME